MLSVPIPSEYSLLHDPACNHVVDQYHNLFAVQNYLVLYLVIFPAFFIDNKQETTIRQFFASYSFC